MSTLPPPPPALPPGASATQISDAAAAVPSQATGVTAGAPPAALVQGVVQSVQWGTGGTADSLTATISGNATPVPGIAFMAGYTPVAGDTVWILVAGSSDSAGTDHLVMGVQSSAGASAGSGIPIGAMLCSPTAISDPAWLLCNGNAVPASCPKLLAMMANTPDMRGYSPMGAGATVGLGSTAGASTHAMSLAEMAVHNHGVTQTGHAHGVGSGTYFMYDGGGIGLVSNPQYGIHGGTTTGAQVANVTVNNAGTGTAFSILHPVRGVNWYIRAL